MRKEIADHISRVMLDVAAKLNDSIRLVQENCEEGEFRTYRGSVGRIMGLMLTEIMNPLYGEHPDLRPPGLNKP